MADFGFTSRLTGKTVLVTGASSGIGAATAKLFATFGANLVLVARRVDRLAEVKDECLKAGNGKNTVEVIAADMAKKEDIDGIIPKLNGKQVDILVNNAGLALGRDQVGEIKDDDLVDMITVNVLGLIRLTQKFVPEMKKQGFGLIVNLGSIAGREAYPGGSIYCAAKHAVAAFSSSLMKELVNTNIRVCEIQPGMVETEFSVVRNYGDKAAADEVYKGITPLSAQDIAEEIVWVASRPEHVQVAQILIFPTAQASAGIAYRKP